MILDMKVSVTDDDVLSVQFWNHAVKSQMRMRKWSEQDL